MRRFLVIFSVLICFGALLMASGLTSHASDIKTVITQRLSLSGDICSAVKTSMNEGNNTKETVKIAILMGHGACYCQVIQCALNAGGSLEQIIFGGIEAGISSDVLSRCAIDAGAQPADVARVLRRGDPPGLGYSDPPVPGVTPVPTGFNGGTPKVYLSPSRF
jgi:hypothetical protein